MDVKRLDIQDVGSRSPAWEGPRGTETELDWEFIKAQLPAGWRELARERGLIRPAQKAISRAEGEQAAEQAKLVELSPPALHSWERRLGPYLAELLARMLDPVDLFSPLRGSGDEIVLADGTTVTRPGAEGTTARVLYALRLADLTVVSCQMTDAHGSESIRVFEVSPGQLWIADRLYSNPLDVAWAVDAGADVLVRCNLGALPLYERSGQRFDVLDHVRLIGKPDESAEWQVQVHLQDHAPLQGRLCAVRLPDQQAEKARERLRREYGSDVSPISLEAAKWVIVFTTVPPERMMTLQALELYRLRWQIELEIRRDKSLGGLDQLPNFREDTIATWLYAKLLIHQIARKIVSPTVAFPPSAIGFDLLPSAQRHRREAAPRPAAHHQRTLAGHD